MKVLGISGSPRRGGNTELLINKAFEVFEQQGIETELISLAKDPVKPCIGCGGCIKAGKCVIDDPAFDEAFEKFKQADAYLIGSPVYYGSATPQIMSLLDRVGFVCRFNDNFLRRKVAASIAVARRAGATFTFAQLNYFFLINEMIVPGSTYWNVAYGLDKGHVAEDEEGVQTIETLAENMAWLMEKINSTDHE